jgi:hypothetical protein
MSVMGIDAAIGVVQDRNETPHEWDWELAEAATVAVKEIATLKARVDALEKLGPLIEEYGKQRMFYGMHGDKRYMHLSDEAKSQIDAILTGGAP